MFDGMPDQFYQFLAATSRATNSSSTTTTTATISSLPLSFSIHHANFPHQQQQQEASFDPSYLLHHPQLPLHLQQQQQHSTRNEAKKDILTPSMPWSSEEVLALLKIRSSMDNPWFPAEFTWENVSRKLEEVGFKRNAENCKEKFEEETRSFDNNIVINSSKNNVISQNYRLFGELEELYNCNDDHDNTNDNHNKERSPPNQLDDMPNDPQPLSLCPKNQSQDINNDNVSEVQEKSGNDETGERDRHDDSMDEDGDQQFVDDSEKLEENAKVVGKKRKRQKKFELFKGFCEKIVNKMMAQQEEFHCKILQDMVKRDKEKIAREEAWKKQEIDRITKELEVRAHEQAIVGDRQAKILGYLNKFSSSSNLVGSAMIKVPNTTSLSTSSSILSQDCISATQLTSSCATIHDQNSILSNLVSQQKCNLPPSLSKENLAPQSPNTFENPTLVLPISSSLDQAFKNSNPIISNQNDFFSPTSISTTHKSFASNHTSTDAPSQVMDFKHYDNHTTLKLESVKDDTGRRWPREEVLALINIRCSLFNNNGDHHDKESMLKGPLWERISQKMMELGYKRSSKRCKEKWENINKYFRKTKDLNKRRSIDSRTCPYFHQLSHLYEQGPLHGQSDLPENHVGSPENQSTALSGGQGGSNTSNGATTSTVHGNEGSVVQVSAGFGFEF